MRRLGRFGWDAANSRHVERRGVSPREAEEVILEQPLFRRTRCDRFIAYGRTVDGRYLTVIFCLKQGDIVRVITARAMTTPVNGDTMREGVITTRRRIPKFTTKARRPSSGQPTTPWTASMIPNLLSSRSTLACATRRGRGRGRGSSWRNPGKAPGAFSPECLSGPPPTRVSFRPAYGRAP